MWHGQPARGATQHAVIAYYRDDWIAVLAGNALWLPGCVGLLAASSAALALAGRREPHTLLDRVAPACGRIAIGLMLVSGLSAVQLSGMVRFVSAETSQRQWRFESGLFDMALNLWTLYLLASVALAWRRRSALAVIPLLIAAALVVSPGIGFWCLLAWFVVATLVRSRRTPA